MYVIVKTDGKQYKVAGGDLVEAERIEGEPGSSVALTPVLLVDSADVIADADKLTNVTVNARIVEAAKDPKIRGIHYKDKAGYKRHYGHHRPLIVLKITGVSK